MDTAIIIPTHSPKFHYTDNLLKSIYKNKIKTYVFLIFSNYFEFFIFNCFYPGNKYRKIIMPASQLKINGIVNQKKFYGLNLIFTSFPDIKYVATIDCESFLNKPFNVFDKFEEIFQSGYVKANKSLKGGDIIKNLAKLLSPSINYKNLEKKTQDFSLYWWFNELCVYERSTFLDFYNWYLKLENYKYLISNYWCFDYLLYTLFLIDKNLFLIKLVTSPDHFFEYGALEQNFDNNISSSFQSAIDRNPLAVNKKYNLFTIHIDFKKTESLSINFFKQQTIKIINVFLKNLNL